MPRMLVDFTCDECGLPFEELVDRNNPEEMSPECPGCKDGHGIKEDVQGNPKHTRHVSWSSWNAGE